MEKIDILIWAMGSGFAVMFAALMLIFKILREDIGSLRNELKSDIGKLDQRMDRFEEKLTDIDRRLCRLEGAFSSKDFCMLKDQRYQGEKIE